MKQKYMVMVTLLVTILFSVTYAYSTNLLSTNAHLPDSVLYTSSDILDRFGEFPEFVQTATRFDAAPIESHTTRYFSIKKTTSINNFNLEFHCFSLYNAGNIMVRVSGINALTFSSNNAVTGNIGNSSVYSMYKNGTPPGGSFFPFSPSSVIQLNVNAGFLSGGTLVFETYSSFDNILGTGTSTVSTSIPKELYSVMIEPGETLTLTALCGLRTSGTPVQALTKLVITIEWEEIIN
jgi:hypothetical protein